MFGPDLPLSEFKLLLAEVLTRYKAETPIFSTQNGTLYQKR